MTPSRPCLWWFRYVHSRVQVLHGIGVDEASARAEAARFYACTPEDLLTLAWDSRIAR